MKRWLLDTSALLTLRDDEPGAERVAELLLVAQQGKAECLACFMTGMELLYRVWRDEGEAAGRLAHEQCLALPIHWVHESPELLLRAAEPHLPVLRPCVGRQPTNASPVPVQGMWLRGTRRCGRRHQYPKGGTRPVRL